jgi:hypothetical protein
MEASKDVVVILACHVSDYGALVKFIYSHLGKISIFFGLASLIGHWIYYKIKSYEVAPIVSFQKLFAGFVIPSSPAIILAILINQNDLLGCIEHLELYVMAGAISSGWVAWLVLFPPPPKPAPPTSR